MQAIALLLILGLSLGIIIGLAAKFFGVSVDPKLEAIEELLPGANCGACGFAGCADFAKAIYEGNATPNLCPVSSAEEIQKIGALIGVEVSEREAKVAVVRCGGDNDLAQWGAAYNGIADCRSANLVLNGPKACKYGCLGLGTCSRVCPFDAIEITAAGLAVVHPDVCTGCGKCVGVCPRGIIELVPKSTPIVNLCNNPEKGAASRKVCSVSCIACRKCVNSAGDGQMVMDGNLARVNYDDPPGPELAEVCPTKCLQPSLLVKNTMPALQPKEEVVHG